MTNTYKTIQLYNYTTMAVCYLDYPLSKLLIKPLIQIKIRKKILRYQTNGKLVRLPFLPTQYSIPSTRDVHRKGKDHRAN